MIRERIKNSWDRRPRLGRGGKTIRNFLCAGLFLVYFWGIAGYPLPTAEMEFRRLERIHLMPESEIFFSAPKASMDFILDDGNSMELIDPCVVGLGEDWAAVGYPQRAQGNWDTLNLFSITEGPSAIPLNSNLLYVFWDREMGFSQPLLFCRIPEEAARGEMDLRVTYMEQDYQRSSPVWHLGDGVWIASIDTPDGGYSSTWYQGGNYTLRLYRADGSLLLEQDGVIPCASIYLR